MEKIVETKSEWKTTANRFVAFFDIMGFKELVERNKHADVVAKLNLIKRQLKALETAHTNSGFDWKDSISETKSITFSDSIIFFSKGDTLEDACKIILDSAYLVHQSLKNGLGIKGALAYGEITVDFENSLFFGRPIIDAYLLHDLLQLYSGVIDNSFEAKLNTLTLPEPFTNLITEYKTSFKTGKITHKLVRPDHIDNIKDEINFVLKLKESISGSPRIYVDNTLDYLNSLLPKEKIASGEKPSQ